MADVKWIKIVTDIFDDEKILLIESMPEADAIIVIWFKLLCLAGKQNNSGVFLLHGRIPYTEEMFATIFRRPINTVRLALNTFEQFGMIEIVNNTVTIPNWGKHQNLDQIESKREYMRGYMAEYRQKQKALTDGKTNSKTNSKANVSEADKIREDKKEIREEKNTDKAPAKPAPVRHRYGKYENVLLSDEELEKVKTEFPDDWQDRIEKLSEYMASNGKTYKNYLATIRNWKRMEDERGYSGKSAAGNQGKTGTDEGRVFGILI